MALVAPFTNLGIGIGHEMYWFSQTGKLCFPVTAGVSMNAGVYSEACVIRLNSNGTLDTTFSGPPPANGNGLVRFGRCL